MLKNPFFDTDDKYLMCDYVISLAKKNDSSSGIVIGIKVVKINQLLS